MTHYVSARSIGKGTAEDPFRPPWSGLGPDWVMVGEEGAEYLYAFKNSLSRAQVDRLLSDFSGRYRGTDSQPLPVQDKRDPYNLPALKQRSGTETETFARADGAGWTTIDQTWAKIAVAGTTAESIATNRGRIARSGADGTTIMYMSAHSAEDNDLLIGYYQETTNGVDAGGALRVIPAGPHAYYCLADITGNDLRAFKLVAGVVTMIAETLNTITAASPFSIRFDATTEAGPVTRLQIRVWDASLAEPGTWDLNFTNNDAALQSVAGNPGVAARPHVSNARAADFDDVAWTNNDGAPPAATRRHVVMF